MDTLTYSKLRANLKSALDRAVDDHEVIVVEQRKTFKSVAALKNALGL